jgi:hypothetical protein
MQGTKRKQAEDVSPESSKKKGKGKEVVEVEEDEEEESGKSDIEDDSKEAIQTARFFKKDSDTQTRSTSTSRTAGESDE